MNLNDLLERIRKVPQKSETKLVAIDGRGGSGKSSLARELHRLDPDMQIIALDDFPYRPSEHPFHSLGTQTKVNWKRLEQEVLIPLTRGEVACYRKTFWWERDLTGDEPELEVLAGKTTVIEGLTSFRRELRAYYDFSIWVACPRNISYQRAMERDGGAEKNRQYWEEAYLPVEDAYISEHRPEESVDALYT